jgi:hypothetical protein
LPALPQFQPKDRQAWLAWLELRLWPDPPESRLEPNPAGRMLFRTHLTGLQLQPRDKLLSFPTFLSLFGRNAERADTKKSRSPDVCSFVLSPKRSSAGAG